MAQIRSFGFDGPTFDPVTDTYESIDKVDVTALNGAASRTVTAFNAVTTGLDTNNYGPFDGVILHFLARDGVSVEPCSSVTYVHFLCDQHEIITSNGAATKTFYAGDEALNSVGQATRNEFFTICATASRCHKPPVCW